MDDGKKRSYPEFSLKCLHRVVILVIQCVRYRRITLVCIEFERCTLVSEPTNCAELGISRQTLYRFVGPKGELRSDGERLLKRKKQSSDPG